MARDLSGATGAPVDVALVPPDEFAALPHGELDGEDLDVAAGDFRRQRSRRLAARRRRPRGGADAAHAPVPVAVPGDRPARLRQRADPPSRRHGSIAGGLLRYLVSFRGHPGFHEHCVERIFADVWTRCRPQALTVHARFTRRGGVDINPWRTSGDDAPPPNRRTARQ